MGRIVFLAITLLFVCHQAQAQSYRYMDKSGNIFWVDSIEDVPPEYRAQVVKPTPQPVLNKKQQRQVEAERKRIEKEKEKEEKAKEKKKKKQEKERQKKQKEKEKGKNTSAGEESTEAKVPGPSARSEHLENSHKPIQPAQNPAELEDAPENQ